MLLFYFSCTKYFSLTLVYDKRERGRREKRTEERGKRDKRKERREG